jgi:hypothetical protein
MAVTFSAGATGNRYYLKVTQRNHIEIWSAETQLITSVMTYNFTDDWTKAYEFPDNPFHGTIEVEPGVWAMYVGDINQDGFVDAFDTPELAAEIPSAFPFGYQPGDLNGDGSIDSFDVPLLAGNIVYFGGVYSQHP